jgi:hypothetical protein
LYQGNPYCSKRERERYRSVVGSSHMFSVTKTPWLRKKKKKEKPFLSAIRPFGVF